MKQAEAEHDLKQAEAERDLKQAEAARDLYQKPTVLSLVISHTFNSPYVLRLYDKANESASEEAAKQVAGDDNQDGKDN